MKVKSFEEINREQSQNKQKKEVKGKIMKKMKVLAVATMVSLGALSMVACKKGEPEVKIERDVQGSGIGEYKGDKEVIFGEKTNNENGVKIYGKIVDANTASETGKKIIEKNVRNDKAGNAEGYTYIYSEYQSDSYGGTVYIKTVEQNGYQEIYNENGQRFMGGGPEYDLEECLAKYRLGNAMAEAIDRKVKKKK